MYVLKNFKDVCRDYLISLLVSWTVVTYGKMNILFMQLNSYKTL